MAHSDRQLTWSYSTFLQVKEEGEADDNIRAQWYLQPS